MKATWFYITIAIESSIIPIHDLVFEHRLYLPMIGVFIALLSLIHEIMSNRRIIKYVSFSIIIILAIVGFNRISVWKSNVSLWEDTVKKSPEKIRPFKNLAHYQYVNKNYTEALKNYDKGIINLNKHINYIIKNTPQWNINTSLLIFKDRGLTNMQVRKYKNAIHDFTFYLQNTTDSYVYFERAQAYKIIGEYQKALDDLYDFLKKYNKYYSYLDIVHKEIGYSLLQLGKYHEAIIELNKAIDLNSNNAKYFSFLAFCYFQLGDYAQAVINYQTASELNPDSKEFRENINKSKFLLDKKNNQ